MQHTPCNYMLFDVHPSAQIVLIFFPLIYSRVEEIQNLIG